VNRGPCGWPLDALLTGATVFPYALRVSNFLAVSDSPIRFDKKRWRVALEQFKIEGNAVFKLQDSHQEARLDEVLHLADTVRSPDVPDWLRIETGEGIKARLTGARIVTDDNLATEWH